MRRTTLIWRSSRSGFSESLEHNLISAFVTLQTALPNLRATNGDRSIAFTTSTDAMVSYGLPAYAAAKGGIIGLVNSLTNSLGGEGIRITRLRPATSPLPEIEPNGLTVRTGTPTSRHLIRCGACAHQRRSRRRS